MRFGIGLPQLFCLEGDETGRGSGSGSSGNEPPRRENPADLVQRYSGGTIRLASDLAQREGENFTLRERNRDLCQEIADLRGNVPGEGST